MAHKKNNASSFSDRDNGQAVPAFRIFYPSVQRFPSSRCFREIAETLQHGLENLGYIADVSQERFAANRTNIVLVPIS